MKVLFSSCIPFLILTLVLFNQLSAQVPETIPAQIFHLDALLDPGSGSLDVEYDLEYLNNSTDTLYQLVFHIWANAFSKPGSAYGQQKLLFKETEFYFMDPDDRISYRFLQFSSGADFITYEQVGTDPDIIRVNLKDPLLPGAKSKVHADYRLAIPGFHSRLGTDGKIWQLAHWFPKPARYVDHQWKMIPYLELGEFIQDFANYQISLTLPDSFVVVSTGAPVDEATKSHRETALSRTKSGLRGLPADGGRRTWTFNADWVPDVALACSPYYFLEEEMFPLQDGRIVTGQTAYTINRKGGWKEDALSYVRQSTQFYDQHVGPYPWPYVSAVQGVKQFSGGMEYPMITYIQPGLPPSALDEVIAHEIGHNWFFGVLSTNERDYPWMDEGLNSYYDHRYSVSRRTNQSLDLPLDAEDWLVYGEAGKRLLPIPSEGIQHMYSEIDYQVGAYTIPSQALRVLEMLYGQEAVDQAFQAYYQKWAFGHPLPGDLQRVFEDELKAKLDWLFVEALSKPFVRDLSFGAVQQADQVYRITIKQSGLKGAPWALQQRQDLRNQTNWYPGFYGNDTTVLVQVDPAITSLSVHGGVPDLHPANDQFRIHGWPHRKSGWEIGIGAGIKNATAYKTYLLPILGLNVYDGFQLGLALHNQKVYYQPSGFFLGGLYGFKSEHLGYSAAAYQDIYLDGGPDLIRLGIKARSNSFFTFNELSLDYHRFNPYIEWQSRAEIRPGETHWRVGLYGWLIGRQSLDFNQNGYSISNQRDWDRIYSMRSSITRADALLPWSIRVDAEYQPYTSPQVKEAYLKTGIELKLASQFMHKRFVQFRVFVGGFPYNTRRNAGNVSNPYTRGSYALSFQGENDYRFEEPFFGRSEQTGFSSQQIFIREGGFKTALGPAFGQGQSNHLISAINVRSDLPLTINMPIQIYSDLGYWSDRTYLGTSKSFADQVWWDMGLQISLLDDRLQVFFPVFQNKNLNSLLEQRSPSYWSRITWSINLNLIQLPWDIPSLF